MDFSIVIPARNEEKFIGGCLDSIDCAAAEARVRPEIIVVLNRCTDRTEAIAAGRASFVREDAKNLARIRNAGAAAGSGDVLVTIDADSRMSPNMLSEIRRALDSGRYVGGGVPGRPDRYSAGIIATGLLLITPFLLHGVSGGLFWCRTADFRAMGGFNESMHTAEDWDFALRLKAYARKQGKRFGTLWRTHIVTSCRKFDTYGDWFVLKMLLSNPRILFTAFRGTNRELGNRYWYGTD